MKRSTMTRRSFVKAAALAGAAAAIGVSSVSSLEETDEAYAATASTRTKYRTACHGCIQVCPVIAYVEDGVVVKLEGDPAGPQNKGSLCMKGLNQLQTCYSPRHILHPMKLAGERGSNQWEQISWDEAIELAATKYNDAQEKYGNYAFFASVGGGGSYSFGNAMTLPYCLESPTVFEPGCAQCYLPRTAIASFMWGGADQSIADSSVAEPWNEYKPTTNMLVLWAAQPSVSQTSQSGRSIADLRVGRGCHTVVIDPNFSPDAAKADVWLSIRPGTDTKLALCWIRYIIENKLYDETSCKYWTNLPFLIDPDTKLPLEAYQVWPDQYQKLDTETTPTYVCYDNKTKSVQPFPYTAPENSPVDPEVFTTATVNGKSCETAGQLYWDNAEPWTLEKAAEDCWLEADKIEKAIRLYTDAEVAGIANGVALDMSESSSELPLALMGLDFMMGYFDRPGCTLTNEAGGMGPMGSSEIRPTKRPTKKFGSYSGTGYTVGQSAAYNQAAVTSYQGYTKEQQDESLQILKDRIGMINHKGLYVWSHSHIPSVREAIATGEPFRPRVWFDFSGNKLAMLGNAYSWYEVFPNIDFIAGQYPMLTSFHVEAADLVFPCEEWLEVCSSAGQMNYTFLRQDIIHLGETVDNNVPTMKILDKMVELRGRPLFANYQMGVEKEEDLHTTQMKNFGFTGTWEDFIAQQDTLIPKITAPETYWQYYQYKDIVDDGLPAGFATESRKLEVYCTILLKMARTGFPFLYPSTQEACEDYSPICKAIEPVESPVYSTDKDEYPLVITSGRLPYFHHGTMRHSAFARELYPVPDVRMNPATAEKYGIKHQEWVNITSRRGHTISARAYVTDEMQPGVLWMERFWNPECYDASQKTISGGWQECNINCLTKNSAPFNEVFGSYTNRGFTVKIEKGSKPDRVWVEPEEFKPFLPTLTSEPQTEKVF